MEEKLVTIETYENEIEAKIVKAILDDEDIYCELVDENTGTILYSEAVGGIKLMVREEDAERARELIAQAQSEKEKSAEE